VPFGIGEVKPKHFREMGRIAWENRDELGFAWRILTKGTCDGCALGTSGLKDWTIPGTHLCMVRLELLRLNTAGALDPARLADVAELRGKSSFYLRELGRLPEPMVRLAGEPGFRVVTWDDALDRVAARLRGTDPRRVAFYLTSRGITNETYYAAQKAARFLGTNSVDNSARLCHAASTAAMREAIGHGASTCSYVDWLDADLIVFVGSNVPNNQPVSLKYVHEAKERGAQVAVVNPYREPGLERYWVPSIGDSALFGTRFADHWFAVTTGGDLAFFIGVLRALVEMPGGVDEDFVRDRSTGFEGARDAALRAGWDALERESGTTREEMRAFAKLLVDRPKAVLVWSMGLTQHAHGVDTVRALLNVGLARGLPGRRDRGLVPIRGHSGVQGGAEVGCVPGVSAETAARWSQVWGFDVPAARGLTTLEQIEASARGEIDAFWILGGNFLETLGNEERSLAALRRPRLRVHQDIVLSSMMLQESDGDVVLLPATTRYESPGGGTETTTERRIVFSPEIEGRRIGSARAEWDVLGDVMARVRPELGSRVRFADAAAIRAEIALAVPLYAGIETLHQQGDQVQWGGRVLYEDGRFATPDGKARFAALSPTGRIVPPDAFVVSTRRGKQFNSMVQRDRDPLTGFSRDEVLMSQADASRLSLSPGDAIRLRSPVGEMRGRVAVAPIAAGNLEVHWPEGNALLGDAVDPVSLEPDYNAVVTVERLV
jgi:molybdopterin-dependent oxidoreductase alpha subunit